MSKSHVIRLKPLIVCLLIPLVIGGAAAFLTSGSMGVYEEIKKPFLSPPGVVFPVVWTVLYLLLGISSYLVYRSNSMEEGKALLLYGTQFIFNFFWPILFFNLQNFLLSFLCLAILWVLILLMISAFSKADKTAAYLQIPYFLWVTFAGYLNLSIYFMN